MSKCEEILAPFGAVSPKLRMSIGVAAGWTAFIGATLALLITAAP
jgi:hypothetical protein